MLLISTIVMVGSVSYAAYEVQQDLKSYVHVQPGTVDMVPAEEAPAPAAPSYLDYGSHTLLIGEKVVFKDITITPVKVVDDSRCPMNAKCIWAGTTHVLLRITSRQGTSEQTIELGKSITTEAETISFDAVSPGRMAGEELSPSAYRLTFTVLKRTVSAGKCYVGGCSAQLCSDTPNMASTCEYKEEYACYKTATCERQSTGKCGWTPSPELSMCLAGS